MSYPYNDRSIFIRDSVPMANTGLNLQESYNISNNPQIITNAKGALTVEEGTSDTNAALSVKNLGGSTTFNVLGNGTTTCTNLTTLASSGQSLTVSSNQASTSTTSGCAVFYGGIGLSGDVYANNSNFAGNLVVSGTNNVSLKNQVTDWTSGGTFSNYTENHLALSASYTFYMPASPPDGANLIVIDSKNNFATYNQRFATTDGGIFRGLDATGAPSYTAKINSGYYVLSYQSNEMTWVIAGAGLGSTGASGPTGPIGLSKLPVVTNNSLSGSLLLSSNTQYNLGLSGASIITFPSSPASGDEIIIVDVNGSFTSNYCQLVGNGATFEIPALSVAGTSPIYVNQAYTTLTFYYSTIGSKWIGTWNTYVVPFTSFEYQTNSLSIGTNPSYVTSARCTNIGVNSLAGIQYCQENVCIGYETGQSVTSGSYNCLVGTYAGNSITSGTGNTYVGSNAGQATVSNSSNVAVGYAACYSLSSGGDNVAIGEEAMRASTSAAGNTCVGYQSGYNLSGNQNTALGYQALYNDTSGNNNIALGAQALYSGTTASYNVALGAQSLMKASSATGNLSIGYQSMYNCSTGSQNISIGQSSLLELLGGSGNIAIGYSAGGNITSAVNNTLIGKTCAANLTTGHDNVCVGQSALNGTDTGFQNVCIGNNSFGQVGSGSQNNCGLGFNAGYGITGQSSSNICLGYGVGSGNAVNGQLFLGDSTFASNSVNSAFSNTVTNKLKVTIGGSIYYILLSTGSS